MQYQDFKGAIHKLCYCNLHKSLTTHPQKYVQIHAKKIFQFLPTSPLWTAYVICELPLTPNSEHEAFLVYIIEKNLTSKFYAIILTHMCTVVRCHSKGFNILFQVEEKNYFSTQIDHQMQGRRSFKGRLGIGHPVFHSFCLFLPTKKWFERSISWCCPPSFWELPTLLKCCAVPKLHLVYFSGQSKRVQVGLEKHKIRSTFSDHSLVHSGEILN